MHIYEILKDSIVEPTSGQQWRRIHREQIWGHRREKDDRT